MSRWWRFYDDAINDPKLLRLPDDLYRAWTVLLCVASKNGGTLPPADDIALTLRLKPAKVCEWITKLVKAGLFDNVDGVFAPHNWDGRQFKSDTSNERVKRHREKKGNVTSRDNCNVTDTVTVTAPEQSIAETESKQSKADARRLDENGLKQEGALKAVFTGVCAAEYRQPPDMKIIATWLLDGIAPATISTTVPPILKRKADMLSLIYCDAAVREAHARASGPNLQVVKSKPHFVEVGTTAWIVHQQIHKRDNGGRGTPIVDQKDETGAPTGRTGWYFDKPIPDGFDEQTGERIPPAGDEAAA